jgi:hypothetical protein
MKVEREFLMCAVYKQFSCGRVLNTIIEKDAMQVIALFMDKFRGKISSFM